MRSDDVGLELEDRSSRAGTGREHKVLTEHQPAAHNMEGINLPEPFSRVLAGLMSLISLAQKLVATALENRTRRRILDCPYEALLLAFVYRGVRLLNAVAVLCRNPLVYVEEAFVLDRTLLDLVIAVEYMSTEPERLSTRYVDHQWVSKNAQLTAYEKYRPRILSGVSATIQDRIRAQCVLAKKKHRFLNERTWCDRSTAAGMARHIGFFDFYEVLFRLLSGFAHSSESALVSSTRIGPDGTLAVGPQADSLLMVPDAVMWALDCLLALCVRADAALGLQLEDKLEAAVASLPDWYSRDCVAARVMSVVRRERLDLVRRIAGTLSCQVLQASGPRDLR